MRLLNCAHKSSGRTRADHLWRRQREKTGVLAQVQDALKGLDVREFGGIEPNPSYETLMNAVKIAREENITFLLAVGGGLFLMAPNSSPLPLIMRMALTRGTSCRPAVATSKARSRWVPC